MIILSAIVYLNHFNIGDRYDQDHVGQLELEEVSEIYHYTMYRSSSISILCSWLKYWVSRNVPNAMLKLFLHE